MMYFGGFTAHVSQPITNQDGFWWLPERQVGEKLYNRKWLTKMKEQRQQKGILHYNTPVQP